MSATQFYFYAGLLFAALGLSAMFAGIETGIYTLNRIRLAIEVGRARKAAMKLLEEIRFPNHHVSSARQMSAPGLDGLTSIQPEHV